MARENGEVAGAVEVLRRDILHLAGQDRHSENGDRNVQVRIVFPFPNSQGKDFSDENYPGYLHAAMQTPQSHINMILPVETNGKTPKIIVGVRSRDGRRPQSLHDVFAVSLLAEEGFKTE
jgi:hypothetical protein